MYNTKDETWLWYTSIDVFYIYIRIYIKLLHIKFIINLVSNIVDVRSLCRLLYFK